jgi:hypothetical protein
VVLGPPNALGPTIRLSARHPKYSAHPMHSAQQSVYLPAILSTRPTQCTRPNNPFICPSSVVLGPPNEKHSAQQSIRSSASSVVLAPSSVVLGPSSVVLGPPNEKHSAQQSVYPRHPKYSAHHSLYSIIYAMRYTRPPQ